MPGLDAHRARTGSSLAAAEAPPARVLLLGASNLRLGLADAVAAARGAFSARPVDVLAAVGFGRSYGVESGFLGRQLPAIADCGLWRRLDESTPAELFALLTDVGNDLGYGYAPDLVSSWVRVCLERLARRQAKVVVTLVPAGSLRRLGSVRFRLLRLVLFPTSRLRLEELVPRVEELNQRLVELAHRCGAVVVEPGAELYGVDRIHLRPRGRLALLEAVVAGWLGTACTLHRASAGDKLRSTKLRPELSSFAGRQRRCPQPCGVLARGVPVSLF